MQILITWPTLKQSQSLDEAIYSSLMKTSVKAYSGIGSLMASMEKSLIILPTNKGVVFAVFSVSFIKNDSTTPGEPPPLVGLILLGSLVGLSRICHGNHLKVKKFLTRLWIAGAWRMEKTSE